LLSAGDIILEIDGHRIRTEDFASAVCRERYGQVTLAMISLRHEEREGRSANRPPDKPPHLGKAKDLFAKVNEFFTLSD